MKSIFVLIGLLIVSTAAFANPGCAVGTINGLQKSQCASVSAGNKWLYSKTVSCDSYTFTVDLRVHSLNPDESYVGFDWNVTIAGPHGQASADADHMELMDSAGHGAFIRCNNDY